MSNYDEVSNYDEICLLLVQDTKSAALAQKASMSASAISFSLRSIGVIKTNHDGYFTSLVEQERHQ